ncbi:serine--tRNA ligase, partial [Candidatus Pacearchaeota archaeon]
MIDIKLVREQPELIKENLKKRFQEEKIKLVDKVRELDVEWRNLKFRSDKLRHERNLVSREVAKAKKQGKPTKELLRKAKLIPEKLEEVEAEMRAKRAEIDEILRKIPNIISPRVPIGKDENENVVEETFGEKKKPSFEVKSHVEIAESIGADFDSSARVSGKGFYYIEDQLALLNQALIRFAIDKMVEKGYTYVETPLMLRGKVMKSVTDVADQETMIYKIDGEDLYLIGTSEHSLIGRFAGQTLNKKQLPLKQTSYSMCFRREIGSHGVDEKGFFRTHQFNKVEMIAICLPEQSDKLFEEMKNITIEIFKELELPGRVLRICSGDLGDLKHEQVDIEVYSPRKDSYFEVGS